MKAAHEAPQSDYADDEDLIIPMQDATYYRNPHNQIVIRQENRPDDDVYVYFSPKVITALIARLKELAGLK